MEEAQLAAEQEFWVLVKETEAPSDLEAYLEQYPDGVYAPVARVRLAQLRRERRAQQAVASSALTQPRRKEHPLRLHPYRLPRPLRRLPHPSPEDVESSLGLGRGARRMVQAGLASLGYEPGPADGLFGVRTREAIRRYQGEKGFEATGYLRAEESQTLVALGEESARTQAERREAQRRRMRHAGRTMRRMRGEDAGDG